MNQLSEQVIGAAFEVSNVLGVGFLEKVYEKALLHELRLRGMQVTAQQRIEVNYKNECVGEYVADIVVDNRLIVELKCVDAIALEHVAQCLNYLKATGLR
ncbi:MAG: GxxExxY protein, partial [Phycisphaeraceae bacterium]